MKDGFLMIYYVSQFKDIEDQVTEIWYPGVLHFLQSKEVTIWIKITRNVIDIN